jgi:peptidyl-tRNA hydrolase, PTH1 family
VKLIVGLGNPGMRYLNTRHNIGFTAADRIAVEHSAVFAETPFQAQCAAMIISGHRVVVLKPHTFMNLSGEAVRQAAGFYGHAPGDIIVIYDDMDIPFGQLKIKRRGGSGGHRGIASIIDHLQTDMFVRLRVGIGKPPEQVDPADYVLQCFTHAEEGQLKDLIGNVYKCVAVLLAQGPEAAMNLFHRTPQPVH